MRFRHFLELSFDTLSGVAGYHPDSVLRNIVFSLYLYSSEFRAYWFWPNGGRFWTEAKNMQMRFRHFLELSFDTLSGVARCHLHGELVAQSLKRRTFSTNPLTHLA